MESESCTSLFTSHLFLYLLIRVSQSLKSVVWAWHSVIHFVLLAPGHLLHYLCCQVFHCVSCHLCCCYSPNLWRLQRPERWWEMGIGAMTGLYKLSDGCDMPRCQLCHGVTCVMTFPDTGDFWPGSTWCLWGHPSCGASFRCQSHSWALFGDWAGSISPGRVIVIVNQ